MARQIHNTEGLVVGIPGLWLFSYSCSLVRLIKAALGDRPSSRGLITSQ